MLDNQMAELEEQTANLKSAFTDLENPITKLKEQIQMMTDNPILQSASGGITEALLPKKVQIDTGVANPFAQGLTAGQPGETMTVDAIPGLSAFSELLQNQTVPILEGFSSIFSKIPGIGGALSGILGSLAGAFGGVLIVAELLKPVIDGLFSVLSPVINTILKPLFSALRTVGQVIAVVLLPAFFVLKMALLPIVAVITAVTWAFDQVILWANSLPFVGGFLSASEVAEKRKSYGQRMDEYINPQNYNETDNAGIAESTMGQEFSAGSSKNLTVNNYISFERNFIVSEDDKQLKELGDKLLAYFREKGVFENA
jgi:hypothetical protein